MKITNVVDYFIESILSNVDSDSVRRRVYNDFFNLVVENGGDEELGIFDRSLEIDDVFDEALDDLSSNNYTDEDEELLFDDE